MKTITKSFAVLLFAAAFTACSNPTIEPVKAGRTAAVIVRADTTARPQPVQDVKNPRHPIADESVQPEQTGTANPAPVGDTRVRKQRPDGTSLEEITR